MQTAQSEDTEITLGTGKMLALFFGLVAICAVFFAMGFSLGRNSVLKLSAEDGQSTTPISAAVASGQLRSVAAKSTSKGSASELATAEKQAENPANVADNSNRAGDPASAADAKVNPPDPAAPPVLNGYYVQVAAVSKQEDAESLIDALKKKQYPAFLANVASDQLFHVQLGPFSEIKDAEGMRTKLVSDGYNPILKK